MLAKGLAWTGGRSFRRGREAYRPENGPPFDAERVARGVRKTGGAALDAGGDRRLAGRPHPDEDAADRIAEQRWRDHHTREEQ